MTTPLSLPSYKMTDTDFNLVITDAYNNVGGASYGTEITPPYWDATFDVRPSANIDHGYWDGFFKSCRGMKQTFLAYDANRPVPIKQTNPLGMTKVGGGAFPGYATIVSYTDVNTINVHALPNPFLMTTGDYVGLLEGGRYSLHTLVADAVSDGSGASTWKVEPYVNTDYFTTAAQVWVYHPYGEFFLKPGTQPDRSRNVEMKPIHFEARSRGGP